MDINQTIERIIALHDSGGNPSQFMQTIMSQNPSINQYSSQLTNMSKGMTKPQFYLQLARQGGVSEQNIKGLARIMGVKL